MRRRTEQQSIEDVGENDRAADADGEQRDRRERGAAVAHQRAPGEAEILPQRVDAGQHARVVERLTCLRDAAELAPRGEPRLGVRQAASAVLVGQQLEVRLQFLAQLVLATPTGQRTDEACEQHAQARHDSGSKRRLTISTVRAHSCASASSCLRPAAVML